MSFKTRKALALPRGSGARPCIGALGVIVGVVVVGRP